MQVIISSWTFAELVHFRVRSKPVARSQTKETAMPNLIIDRVGERFGRWTVLALHPERSRFGKARWVCRCDCGSERIVYGNSLRRGETTSCGCARLVDLTGQRFGRWQVLALHPERKRQGRYYAIWLCRCDCGSEGIVVAKIAQRLVEKLRLHSKRSMCKTQHHARPVSHSRL